MPGRVARARHMLRNIRSGRRRFLTKRLLPLPRRSGRGNEETHQSRGPTQTSAAAQGAQSGSRRHRAPRRRLGGAAGATGVFNRPAGGTDGSAGLRLAPQRRHLSARVRELGQPWLQCAAPIRRCIRRPAISGGEGYGAPLLKAHFPRVYVDPNREPYELDPRMFDAPLPDYVNHRSPRVAAGLGTVARVVGDGRRHLRAQADVRRSAAAHRGPLCSLPSGAQGSARRDPRPLRLLPLDRLPLDAVDRRADGRRPRQSAASISSSATASARPVLRRSSISPSGPCRRAAIPFTATYPTPAALRRATTAGRASGKHALQIEVNRALYMDETRIGRLPSLPAMVADLTLLIAALAKADPS